MRFLTICLVLSAAAAGAANTQPLAAPASPDTAVQPTPAQLEWQALLSARGAVDDGRKSAPPAGTAGVVAARVGTAANPNLALADQARDFYTKNPTFVFGPEARRIEVLALLDAEEEGEATAPARVERTVAQIRQDKSMSELARAGAVAAFEYRRALRGAASPDSRLGLTEATARRMLAEFPASDVGPTAMLAVASASDVVKAAALAEEVIAKSTDERSRAAARVVRLRSALVGRPLRVLLPTVPAVQALPRGTPLIVYSWSADAAGSVDFGRMVQARRFTALGVCLDTDVTRGQEAQRAANLGGTHIYDAKGTAGVVAEALALNAPGLVYLIDRTGVIRDVRGLNGLESKLNALGFRTPTLVRP